MAAPKLVKTLKVRVRDRHAPLLRAMSREVNFTWNYVNELTSRMNVNFLPAPTSLDTLSPVR